jgi:hypothetical protein
VRAPHASLKPRLSDERATAAHSPPACASRGGCCTPAQMPDAYGYAYGRRRTRRLRQPRTFPHDDTKPSDADGTDRGGEALSRSGGERSFAST